MVKKNNFKIDFIGIGPPKCATTWITKCFREHPQICMRKGGEGSFFSNKRLYEKGIDYYKPLFKKCSQGEIKGELSHDYIFSSKSPSRIYEHFPEVKIIASLRDPIERAYSHYRFAKRWKGPLGIYDNLVDAVEKGNTKEGTSLKEVGKYAKHLNRYLDYFPKESIYIVLYKDIKENPVEAIQGIYDFLEVDPDFIPKIATQRVNPTGEQIARLKLPSLTHLAHVVTDKIKNNKKLYHLLQKTPLKCLHGKLISWNRENKTTEKSEPTSVEDLTAKEKKELYEIYREDVNELEGLIDRDLTHWKY